MLLILQTLLYLPTEGILFYLLPTYCMDWLEVRSERMIWKQTNPHTEFPQPVVHVCMVRVRRSICLIGTCHFGSNPKHATYMP